MKRLAVLLVLVSLMACGDDDGEDLDTGGSEATTTDGGAGTTAAPKGSVELLVEVDDGSSTREATLRCAEDGSAEGTGYLADPADAAAACELLATSDEARTRLVDGAPADRLCTQVYGGPEVATIEGAIDGEPVRTTVNRSDGCGIAEWDLLTPLLGPPGS